MALRDFVYDIENASYTDLGFSDEFTSSTLSSQWTPVDFSNAQVDLFETPQNAIYDLKTRPGTLLLQQPVNSGTKGIRLDSIPLDGEQFIIAFSPGGTESTVNNSSRIQINLTQNSGGPNDGTSYYIYYDGEDNGVIKIVDTTASISNAIYPSGIVTRRGYFRIINSGGTLYNFFSVNGVVWCFLDTITASDLNYTWLAITSSNSTNFSAIHQFFWFRHSAYTGFNAF